MLLDAHPDWTPPAHLRAILLGGAAASARLLHRAAARRLPIVITYGCTETCSQVVATPYEMRFDAAACGAGRPLPAVQLRIDDGHIQVRGPMLMAGYLGEPPLAPDAWFDTGDLGETRRPGLPARARAARRPDRHRRRERLPGRGRAGAGGLPRHRTPRRCSASPTRPGARPSPPRWWPTGAAERRSTDRLPRRAAGAAQAAAQDLLRAGLPQTAAGKLDRLALPALAPALRPLRSRRG